jgi:hypothetical protein
MFFAPYPPRGAPRRRRYRLSAAGYARVRRAEPGARFDETFRELDEPAAIRESLLEEPRGPFVLPGVEERRPGGVRFDALPRGRRRRIRRGRARGERESERYDYRCRAARVHFIAFQSFQMSESAFFFFRSISSLDAE